MARPERRMDQGKSPVVDGCFRYFPRALLAVGLVSKSGCDKYKVELRDKGWLSYTESELINSEGRHILKEEIEGRYDSDSGMLHKAHIAWNALADLEKLLSDGQPLEKEDDAPTEFSNPNWDGVVDTHNFKLVCDHCNEKLAIHCGTMCLPNKVDS